MELAYAHDVQEILKLLGEATEGVISLKHFPVIGNKVDLSPAQFIFQRGEHPNTNLIDWIKTLASQQAENKFVDANTLARGREILPDWVPFASPRIDCSPLIDHWSNRTRQAQERHPNASKRGPGRHRNIRK